MSADGRSIVFTSAASNLGAIRPSAGHDQVYLRDVADGSTRVISAAGGVLGDDDSDRPVISADGMFVAFISTAKNLVSSSRSGNAQVLLWSRATDALSLVSLSNDAVPNPANGRAIGVSISGDGSKVVFSSNATNLTGDSTAGVFQIYVRDVVAGSTALVSVDTRTPRTGSSADAVYPSISADGRIVAYATSATLTAVDALGKGQIYTRDLTTGVTELVSTNASGSSGSFGQSYSPTLSADGRVIGFVSDANDITRFGSDNRSQVYVRDRAARSTELVSLDAADSAPSNAGSFTPSLSRDGSVVAFESTATNLVPETGAQRPGLTGRIYVRDLAEGRTRTACRSSDAGACDSWSGSPSLSADGGRIAFVSDSANIVSGVVEADPWQVYLHDLSAVPSVSRIAGPNRYEVSAATATSAFSTGVPVAYVASGATFPDALSGSAAAGAQRGPILLVAKDSIPIAVGIELQRLKPRRIVVLGGTSSVDARVEMALAAYTPSVSRISGADRFVVSAAVSESVFGWPDGPGGEHPRVYIASGEVFPDALSGAAAAGTTGSPVLLVKRDGVPDPVMVELRRLAPREVVVLGGTSSVSLDVVAALRELAPVTRIDGPDRFAVSASISKQTFTGGARTVYVTSGSVFPDALSGSAAAIQNRGPVLLVTATEIPPTVAAELHRLDPTEIVVLGGEASIAPSVLDALRQYVEPI
jgi:putative cell wall-binding protein/Tol biopolymer transport system component